MSQNKNIKNIFRSNGSFVKIDKLLITSNLSGDAFKILTYMLSKPQGWIFRQEQIAKDVKMTLYAVRKATTELQKKGFLNISKYRPENSKVFETMYWVYELPIFNRKFMKEFRKNKELKEELMELLSGINIDELLLTNNINRNDNDETQENEQINT